ncbi:hypothetical protein PMAYCL1PPCAC_18540, partial [Pristionchus mayeri]
IDLVSVPSIRMEESSDVEKGGTPLSVFPSSSSTSTSNREREAMEREGLLEECLPMEEKEREEISDTEMTSPMRTLNDVLMEAETIFSGDGGGGEWREARKDEDVLMDEVDLEYSPTKKSDHHPIEIVVRHNKVVSTNRDDSDSDDDRRDGRRWRRKDEKDDEQRVVDPSSTRMNGVGKREIPFRKGHRRAWSMPNGKGVHSHIDVLQDTKEGTHRKRVVKYRLHPHKRREGGGKEDGGHKVTFQEMGEIDDENELEIEINEEEIVYPADEGGKGKRTIVKRFWEARWKAQNFEYLPEWLQDNEYLRTGHRPPLPSFGSCFKSIFALHTETGNIWTHMYGCVLFVGVALWFLLRPALLVPWQEKLVFSAFFLGAVCCLGLSFTFHTVQCHSQQMGSLFSKLDYTGISLLIMGSFVPWIHYGFYCRPAFQIVYISMIVILGTSAMIVSLWDKFAEPKFRPVRAGVFVAMGLSSIVPAFHLLIVDGFHWMMENSSLGWLLLMGALYLTGATVYATRIPERCFPGKCDLWFQSHQLFHTFVVIAALVHLHGISSMAMNTLQQGSCPEQLLANYGLERNANWLATTLGLDEPENIVSWTPEMLQPL